MIGQLLENVSMDVVDNALRATLLKLSDKFYFCSADKKHQFPNRDGALQAEIAYRHDGKQFDKAIQAAQQGVRGGGMQNSLQLKKAFNATDPQYSVFYGVPVDKERSRRYGIIDNYLSTHSELKPELHVQEIDDIVPLPPAPLPEWDGKLAIQRFVEGDAPPKPDE
ncbi:MULTISPECIES: DUF6396 domain-containing protein, partial [unclassified Neisseria]|uniref:DUF6396 domain-containing protein n=1 Tax=unclassified Neisseria TaxID=2623750 RepID=UPI002666FD71